MRVVPLPDPSGAGRRLQKVILNGRWAEAQQQQDVIVKSFTHDHNLLRNAPNFRTNDPHEPAIVPRSFRFRCNRRWGCLGDLLCSKEDLKKRQDKRTQSYGNVLDSHSIAPKGGRRAPTCGLTERWGKGPTSETGLKMPRGMEGKHPDCPSHCLMGR